MSDLKELTQTVIAFRDARNWAQFHKPKEAILAMFLEVAELAEHFQWKNDQELTDNLDQLRPALGAELADVLYWVLLLSSDLGIDLEATFKAKMAENEAKYPVEKAQGRHTKYHQL